MSKNYNAEPLRDICWDRHSSYMIIPCVVEVASETARCYSIVKRNIRFDTLFYFKYVFCLRFRKMQRFHGSPFWHQFRCGELCLATCPQTGDYTPFSSACQCSFLISYTSIYRRYANLKGKTLIARWCGLIIWPLDFMFERLRSNFTSERKSVLSKH